MARISTYNLELDIAGGDKWIGTSVLNNDATKNFTVDDVAAFFNNSGSINSQTLRYTYKNLPIEDDREQNTISFLTEIGATVPFSSITTWVLSQYSKPGTTDVSTFYDAPLVGSNILLTNANNPKDWAIYTWNSSTQIVLEPLFYDIGLTFISGTGGLVDGQDYIISLLEYDIIGGGLVDSVNGQIGVVVLDTDDVAEGTTNLYYTESRVTANTSVAANTAKVGITPAQASDIVTNNAKISYTDEAAVALNTAKVTFPEAPIDQRSYVRNDGDWINLNSSFASLTDNNHIVWDASQNGGIVNATVTLGGNRILDTPTNLKNGAIYNLIVTQDATGSRTLAFEPIFKWAGGVAPTLSTAANAVDIFTFIYDGTNLYGSAVQNFS